MPTLAFTKMEVGHSEALLRAAAQLAELSSDSDSSDDDWDCVDEFVNRHLCVTACEPFFLSQHAACARHEAAEHRAALPRGSRCRPRTGRRESYRVRGIRLPPLRPAGCGRRAGSAASQASERRTGCSPARRVCCFCSGVSNRTHSARSMVTGTTRFCFACRVFSTLWTRSAAISAKTTSCLATPRTQSAIACGVCTRALWIPRCIPR